MELHLEIDPRTGAAIGTASGELQLQDIMAAAERVWDHEDFGKSLVLWDLRGASFDLSATDVVQMAAFAKAGSVLQPPARMAFVVSEDLEYGLVRMFAAFREQAGVEVRAFRSRDEAFAWIEATPHR